MAVKILIIDDAPSSRDYLKALLEQQFTVIEAVNGKEGLALCLEHKPDLVLCDILMPEMDGYTLVSEIRRKPHISDTTVIFLTAHFNDAEAYELAQKAGVLNVISKPCEPEVLLRKVKDALVTISYTDTQISGDEYRSSHERLLTNKLVEQSRELYESRERIASLIELNLNLASQKDVSELLAVVCHGSRDLVEADAAVLIVREKSNGQIAQCSISGIEASNEDVAIDAGIFSDVFRKKEVKALPSDQLRKPEDVGLPASFPEFRALLVVPVVSLNFCYGWLCLIRKKELDFDSEDELIMSILAAQTGRIYENGSLYMKVRHHAEKLEQEIRLRNEVELHLTVQYEAGKLLAYAADVDDVIPEVLRVIGEAFAFSAARVWEYDDEKNSLYCAHDWISDQSLLLEFHENSRLMESHGVSGLLDTVVRDAQPIWIEDIAADRKFQLQDEKSRELQSKFGMKGLVAMPILVDKKVRGVLLFRSKDKLPENRRIHDVLNTVSSQIGFFKERVQHKESIESLNRLYAVLSRFNNAIVLSEEKHKLMQLACDIVVRDGNFQMAWVSCFDEKLKNPEVLALQKSEGVSFTADELASILTSGRQAIRKLIASNQPVVRNRLRQGQTDDTNYPLDSLAVTFRSQSYAVLPLNFPDMSDCILFLVSDEADFFDDREMVLLNELAADLSYAARNIENEKKLNYLAFHDPVTHLINRSTFSTEVDNEILQRANDDLFIVIAVLHVNHFREINDSLGYRFGDELLHKVGKRILQVVGDSVYVASLGGKEFGLLIRGIKSKDGADEYIKSLLHSLHMTYLLADIPVNVEMSAGLAFYPEHGKNAEMLLMNADVALRHAKEQSRKFLTYSPEFDKIGPQQLALLGELRGAIENREFFLVYQPKIDLRTMKISGVEALIRWQHPDLGVIYPDSFIPLAEQTDLINNLTFWVISTAMGDIRKWQKEGVNLDLSVNMSVRSLLSTEFAQAVIKMIEIEGFDLGALSFEITESAVMTDPVGSKQTLMSMHEAGVRFSLDDFGTGQSSFTYLKDLPVSKLKIDKSFILGISNPQNAAIVQSAIELGHHLGIEVVGEGVSDETALSFLRKYHCDLGQGFYFSKGLKSKELIKWVRESEWGLGA